MINLKEQPNMITIKFESRQGANIAVRVILYDAYGRITDIYERLYPDNEKTQDIATKMLRFLFRSY